MISLLSSLFYFKYKLQLKIKAKVVKIIFLSHFFTQNDLKIKF